MTVRSLLARTAALVAAGSLVLSGCSITGGSSDDAGTASPSQTTTAAKKARALPSTAWTTAARDTVDAGGTLRLAVPALPDNFNPQQSDAAQSPVDQILAPTVGGAVRLTSGGGWIVDPLYARSVKITSKDPLAVEVKLNRSAVWQGGTPITAKDMVAFWKAQNGSDGAFEVRSTTGYQDIDSVEQGSDKYSYTVTFESPVSDWPLYVYPRLPANVSSSPKLFNSAFAKRAVPSNGPFVVTSLDAETGTIVEKPNPRWWGPAPRLAEINWRVADPTLQAKAYAAGELDAVTVDAATYDTVKGTGNLQRAAGLEWTQLTLNGARGSLKDVDVRRAVAHAIDRTGIARRAGADVGAPSARMGSFVHVPGQAGYRDSSAKIAHNVQKSRTLLAKAGYSAGADGMLERKGKPLTLTMPVAEDTPSNRDRARRIAADLKKVGIAVILKQVPADKFFDSYIVPLEFDIVTFTWRGSPFPVADTKPLFYPIDSNQNFTGLADDKLGSAWDKASATLDDAARFKRVRALDERLFSDVPVVPLAVNPLVMAVRKGLVNYGAAQFEQPDWSAVGFIAKKK